LFLVTTTWKKLMSPYNSFSVMDNTNRAELVELARTETMGWNTEEERGREERRDGVVRGRKGGRTGRRDDERGGGEDREKGWWGEGGQGEGQGEVMVGEGGQGEGMVDRERWDGEGKGWWTGRDGMVREDREKGWWWREDRERREGAKQWSHLQT
jgi:hypothetical protein